MRDGRDLLAPGAELALAEGAAPRRVGTSPRVAVDWPLRFYDADSAAVSPFRPGTLRRRARARP
jgi:3-methyladenine DNA glycosylase Mpg